MKKQKEYTVNIEIQVTAKSPKQAAEYVLRDLRDGGVGEWYFDVTDLRGRTVTRTVT